MQTGLILRRNAGKAIPTDFIELALKNNPKGWGAAIVNDGSIDLNKGHDLDVEMFEETVKAFDKQDITFYLCNSDVALNGDDVSPYEIITEGDKALLVAFVEGNFPSYAEAKSSHPAEFFFINKWLIPKLQDFHELGGIELVMKAVKKDNFKKELMLNVVSRGAITLVAHTGESLTFAQADTAKEYDWGWVSNHYGYGVQAPKETAPPKTERKSMFPSKSTVREKAPVPASSAVAEVVSPPKTETATIKNYLVEKVSPPRSLSRNEKKKWYKNRIGFCPNGWEDCVAVEVYKNPDGKLMSLGEVKKLGLQAAGLPKLENPEKVRDVEPENIPARQTVPVGQEKKVTGLVPIMSPPTREHIKKIMADTNVQKIIGENADIISDPTKAAKLEQQFASFSNQLGMKKIDDFLSWDYEMMFILGCERPDGLAVMCWTFRNMLASRMAKEAAKEEYSTSPSQVDPPEEKPVAKKSMFPSRKVA